MRTSPIGTATHDTVNTLTTKATAVAISNPSRMLAPSLAVP